MYCENCGNWIPDDSKFCDQCGAPVNKYAEAPQEDSSNYEQPGEPVRRPTGRQPGEPVHRPEQKTKKKSPFGFLLKLVAIAAVIFILVFVVWPIILEMRTTTPPIDPPGETAGNVQQGGTQAGTAGSTSEGDTTAIPPGGVMQGAASLGMTDEEKQAAQNAVSGSNGQTAGYDGSERPDVDDFLWYTEGDYGLDNDKGNNWSMIPDDAVILTDPAELEGTWKSLVVYESAETYETTSYQYFNTTLDYDAGDVTVTFDWYNRYYFADDSWEDQQNDSDYVCTGTWTEQGIATDDATEFTVTLFYTLGGKQYALGAVKTSSGRREQLALVRP